MHDVITGLLNALTLISILALIALGFAIVFGLMDIANFAHGEFVTVGAYTLALCQIVAGGEPNTWVYWIGLVLAPLVGAALGLLIEAFVIRPLYERTLEIMLATFGISLILQKSIELAFGARPQTIYSPIKGMISLLGVEYPAYRIFMILVAMGLMALCLFVFARTSFGVDLRAVIQNRTMAEALGIDTRRVSRIAFAAGSALAATAGVLLAPLASVEAHIGQAYIVKAFFVVIVGGIGSIIGTIAGSGLVGGLETFLNYHIDPSAATAAVLVFAIVLIRFRPQGLIPGFSHAHELLGKK